jgi:hypothetical protein
MACAKTFLLSSETFLNRCNKNYHNIITLNLMPCGPLKKYVVKIRMPRLSQFECYGSDRCALALLSFRTGRLMSDDEIPDLFTFLLSNQYNIDTKLTNMMNASPVKLNNKTIISFVTFG